MITLRPFQAELKQKIYTSWGAGNRNVLAVLATGGGKSVVVSDVISDGWQAGKMPQAVVAHRNELVTQMSSHIARRGIPHQIIGSDSTVSQAQQKHRKEFGQSFVAPNAPIAVVGVDTLMARAPHLQKWAGQIHRWVIDECFPAGTMISTVGGAVAIESLSVGDLVIAFDEENKRFSEKKINRLFKNPMPENMVRLTTSGHHVIVCTLGHPIWTRRGWVIAGELNNDDEVLLHNMRRECVDYQPSSEKEISGNRSSLLQSGVLQRISSENIVGNDDENQLQICLEKNVGSQSYESSECASKSFGHSPCNEASPTDPRRERKTVARSRIKVDRTVNLLGFCSTTGNKNQNETRFRLSNVLQTGHGESVTQNSCRSRWKFSRFCSEKNDGREKRCFSGFTRLESVEVFKPSNNGKPYGSFVYNIEVDDLHTYVANEIVVHNCHHLTVENKWGKAVEMFSNAYGLGVTATPVRADGQGLGRAYDGVMDDMVIGPDMRWLIENQYLCDYEIVCPTSDMQVSNDEVSADGDWSSKTLKKAAKKSHIVGDVVQNYGKYAYGRRAIVFATDVETAGEIAASFQKWGLRAEALSAKSLPSWRDQCLRQFESGEIQVLVNVDLFDEGFDCPACDVVIMARPTASLGKYLQMIGRALRYMPGKVALIIDHVSNVVRHHLPDRPRPWTLARRDKRGKQEIDPEMLGLQVCKNCTKPYDKFAYVCPHCGFEKPLPEPRSRSIEMVEGDLMLLDRAALAQMRARMVLESAADVGNRVAAAAGPIAGKGAANRQIEKIAAHTDLAEAIAQWAGIQRVQGLSDREISRKFYHAAGVDVVSVLDASQTRAELEALAQRVKGWYGADTVKS